MGADRRRLEPHSLRSSTAAPLPGAATVEPARGRMPPPEPAAALPNPGLRGAEKPARPLPNNGVCCCCVWPPPLGVRAVAPPRAPAAAGLPPAPTLALLELRTSLEKDGRCGRECRSSGVAGRLLRPALPALPGVEAVASMPRSRQPSQLRLPSCLLPSALSRSCWGPPARKLPAMSSAATDNADQGRWRASQPPAAAPAGAAAAAAESRSRTAILVPAAAQFTVYIIHRLAAWLPVTEES